MFLGTRKSRLTDEELLARYRRKPERSVLGELFVRYSDLVFGVCLKYLSGRELAKDAVMQIFEALPAKIQQHKIERFRGWLYVTSRNHCLMQLRSSRDHQKHEFTTLFMETHEVLNPDGEEPLEDNLGKLTACIEELSADQKDCVKLFFLKEMSYKEVAAATGYDMHRVKSYIQNGKRNLKICMEHK